VESGFLGNMAQIDEIAKENSVIVYVTQAYRKEGVEPDGSIVPPATHSNHLVGHAIDMNLDTPIGWCNGDCLQKAYTSSSYNPYAHQFILDIQSTGMRWGGVFSPVDPVHIDDNTYYKSASNWQSLFDDIQPKCVDLDV